MYNQMVSSLRKAKSISWVAQCDLSMGKKAVGSAKYKIWMQKPNYARIEVFQPGKTTPTGILVLDGETIWKYWPNGKPRYQFEYSGKYAKEYAKYGKSYYMYRPVAVGRHSLGHDIGDLGSAVSMTILDPSTFHGYTDSMQKYIDGVTSKGTAKVGNETCDVIDISFMKGQRSWIISLSRKDHLPRKIKQIVRVYEDIVQNETWLNLSVNPKVDKKLFAWKAPKGWKEWQMPPIEEGLLAKGTPAPDFELKSLDGKQIKLSDYKGKVVWLNFWRCG